MAHNSGEVEPKRSHKGHSYFITGGITPCISHTFHALGVRDNSYCNKLLPFLLGGFYFLVFFWWVFLKQTYTEHLPFDTKAQLLFTEAHTLYKMGGGRDFCCWVLSNRLFFFFSIFVLFGKAFFSRSAETGRATTVIRRVCQSVCLLSSVQSAVQSQYSCKRDFCVYFLTLILQS